MLRYENAIIPPDGRVAMIGDCDDGRGLLLSESVPFEDYSAWQVVGASLLPDGESNFGQFELNEEATWFLGADVAKKYSVAQDATSQRSSVLFPQGGDAIIRTAEKTDPTVVHIRCGPFGLGMSASCAHSHGDLLAPTIWWRGVRLAVDSGTFGYMCKTSLRDAYRATAAHNTIHPRDVEQAEMFELWNWGHVPKASITQFDVVDDTKTFEGHMRSAQGYSHTRKLILSQQPRSLTIQDEITCHPRLGAGPIDWRLHLAPELEVAPNAATDMVLILRHGLPFVAIQLSGFDEFKVAEGHFSPSYGIEEPSRCLSGVVAGPHARTQIIITDADDESASSVSLS
jgi:hypothetical protein